MESDLPLWPEERTDLKLRIAETAARRSGVITPLLKEELWTKIQHSRLERGLEELKVEVKTPVTIPLTSEEQNKVKHRREKNREAAVRCRQKRKTKQMELEQVLERETERNRSLKEQYQTLMDEKQWLMSELGLISTSPATEDSARPWIPTPTQEPTQTWTPAPQGEPDQGRSQIWTPPPRDDSTYVWTPATAEDETSHPWTPPPKEESSGVWTPPPLKEIDVVWTSPLDEEACPPPPESFMYWPSHDELQVVPGVAGEGCSNDPFW